MNIPHFSNDLKHKELLHSLEDIKQNIYFKIEDSKYTQGLACIKEISFLSNVKFHLHYLLHNKNGLVPKTELDNTNPIHNSKHPKQDIILHKITEPKKTSLLNILLVNLDPMNCLSNTNNDQNTSTLIFKKELDTFGHLLKQITTRHKCFRKRLEAYLDSSSNESNEDDLSYKDGDYMLFWSCLLNCILIVVDKVNSSEFVMTYRIYEPLWKENDRSILVIERTSTTKYGFTYFIVDDLESYKAQLEKRSIYEWCDIKIIKKLKLDELQQLCKTKYKSIHLVENGKNIKKSEIIDKFVRLFKN